MSTVCQWIGYCLCLRDHPIHKDKALHAPSKGLATNHTYNAVVIWKEASKEKANGVAFDVILKDAKLDSPRPRSPPKDRPLSQELIQNKLREADVRRLSMETEKLSLVAKDKVRLAMAQQKVAEKNQEFVIKSEKRLSARLESMEINKNAQIRALQDRLSDHAKHVQQVRMTSENYRSMLKQKIEGKMSRMQENRDGQLKNILEKLEEHEKRVQEVLDTSRGFTKRTEEKMISKMELTLKNRENQLQQLMERLKDHEQHIQKVRQNKVAQKPSGECPQKPSEECPQETSS